MNLRILRYSFLLMILNPHLNTFPWLDIVNFKIRIFSTDEEGFDGLMLLIFIFSFILIDGPAWF